MTNDNFASESITSAFAGVKVNDTTSHKPFLHQIDRSYKPSGISLASVEDALEQWNTKDQAVCRMATRNTTAHKSSNAGPPKPISKGLTSRPSSLPKHVRVPKSALVARWHRLSARCQHLLASVRRRLWRLFESLQISEKYYHTSRILEISQPTTRPTASVPGRKAFASSEGCAWSARQG